MISAIKAKDYNQIYVPSSSAENQNKSKLQIKNVQSMKEHYKKNLVKSKRVGASAAECARIQPTFDTPTK
jgi:hypothetical protein